MVLNVRFRKRFFVAKGAENAHNKDAWLINDDIRPLAVKDRTWGKVTYFFFWFSAAATGQYSLLTLNLDRQLNDEKSVTGIRRRLPRLSD